MKKNWIVSIILVTIFFATTILIILIYNAKFVSSHKILLSFIEFYDNDFPQSRELDSTLKVGIVDGGIATSTDELSNITLIQKKFVFNSTLVDSEHATAIAGIIAATKNKKGIKGIVSNVEIINTVVTENGKATQDNISKGIMYCATNGANVINVSIEVDVFESILLEAIRYAAERDIIVNFANGNGGWRVNLKKIEKPMIDNLNFIGSLDRNGKISKLNMRYRRADAYELGEDILSIGINDTYTLFSGTSFACAVATGKINRGRVA